MGSKSEADAVEAVARSGGLSRARDLAKAGIRRPILQAAVKSGRLARLSRGVYRVAEAPLASHENLAEAALRKPEAVVCLLSALEFHGMTTEWPREVWIAIPRGTRRPVTESPPLKVLQFSGPAYALGIEEHSIVGVQVKVYSVAKTVADCFKFRNQIGVTVAVAALRDAWRLRKASADDLYRAAMACRVWNVMKPYVESVTS